MNGAERRDSDSRCLVSLALGEKKEAGNLPTRNRDVESVRCDSSCDKCLYLVTALQIKVLLILFLRS